MKGELLKQGDLILSKCARPSYPPGLSVVPLTFGILVQGSVTDKNTNTLTQTIPGTMPWVLRAIQSTFPTGLYFNIQLPNGRYLLNSLQDILQFGGIGSYTYLLDTELECPPGSKIEVTLDSSVLHTGSTQNVQLLFVGAYKALVKGAGAGPKLELASSLPRYWGGEVNQNILAPGWMGGFGPRTPEGCRDEMFTYSANGNGILGTSGFYNGLPLPGTTINVAAGPYSAMDEIDIENGSDFLCRRLLFDVHGDSTAVGTFLVRVRDGSGYALMDDFFDAAQYIGSSPMGKNWFLRRGSKVFIDLQLVDFSGTGLITIETFLDGRRRRI